MCLSATEGDVATSARKALTPRPASHSLLFLFHFFRQTNNWAVRERTLAPLGLISLGTSTDQFSRAGKGGSSSAFSCDSHDPNTGCMNAMQNARYESGQVRPCILWLGRSACVCSAVPLS